MERICNLRILAVVWAIALTASSALPQTLFTEDAALVGASTNANDFLGHTVSLSGNVIMAGMKDLAAPGAYLFRRTRGVWVEDAKVFPPLFNCAFGLSVAVDGIRAVASDPNWENIFCNGGGLLARFSYEGSWNQAGVMFSPLLPPGFPGPSSGVQEYGVSLAMRGDHLLAGSPGANYSPIILDSWPAVVPHQWNGSSWIAGVPFTGSDSTLGDRFGASVALSVDGSSAVVGAPQDGLGGGAYVFRFDGSVWAEERKLTAGDALANDAFGWSVAVNADGTVVAVGSVNDDTFGADVGTVYIFRQVAGEWLQTQNFGASDPIVGGLYGNAVSISGSRLVVGSPGNDAAYVYRGAVGRYVFVQKLQASVDTGNDHFGWALSLDGDTCVVGARFADYVSGAANSGVVYVYELPDIALTTDQDVVPPGGKVTLTTRGGVSGAPCLLTLSMRSPTAGIGFVVYGSDPGQGTFDTKGQHDLKLAAPPGLSGVTVEFRSYGQYLPGVNGESNPVRVTFQ